MSEGQKWTCDCGYGWLQADNCPICGGSRAEVNAKLQGFGSLRGSAEGTADTTNAERSGDRGVQPAASNPSGVWQGEIAEAIRELAAEIICKSALTPDWRGISRIAGAIEIFANKAAVHSAAK